jgi:two-component system sensor histidine kinase DesK
LIGIKERLEFVNGNLEVLSEAGTKVVIKVPNVVKQAVEKEGKTR